MIVSKDNYKEIFYYLDDNYLYANITQTFLILDILRDNNVFFEFVKDVFRDKEAEHNVKYGTQKCVYTFETFEEVFNNKNDSIFDYLLEKFNDDFFPIVNNVSFKIFIDRSSLWIEPVSMNYKYENNFYQILQILSKNISYTEVSAYENKFISMILESIKKYTKNNNQNIERKKDNEIRFKFFKHLKTVLRHKRYVFYYCYKAGIVTRGLLHDLSKFTPTEFIESVKYFQGNRSPIDACKEVNGYSKAWMHHKGRNKHHYEYWQDNFDKGGNPIQMPFKDALEMVCDYLGAGNAYQKKDFTLDGEYEWWLKKISNGIAMHPQTLMFVDMMLKKLARSKDLKYLNKKYALAIYKDAERHYKNNK